MSWRRFVSLLSGLSADSVFYYAINNRPVVIEDAKDVAMSIMASIGARKK